MTAFRHGFEVRGRQDFGDEIEILSGERPMYPAAQCAAH